MYKYLNKQDKKKLEKEKKIQKKYLRFYCGRNAIIWLIDDERNYCGVIGTVRAHK